nr:hypothetical protein [Tanacetum cinerariifolium]
MVAILEKSDAAEGFEQIIDFLSGSYINHALTVNPHVYISCIKQFWNTAVVKRSGDVTRLQALVDKKRIVIAEEVVREILLLNDATGVICLSNEEIFAGLARMGYEKPSTKLTFYKAFFSTQWKFFIHTILHSLSAKKTSWNEFSSAMASALICLSSSQRVGKGFSRAETPLFENMLAVRDVAEEAEAQVPAQGDDVQELAAEEVATDVFVEATPLAQKVPVVDYQIVVIDNKPKRYHGYKKNPQSESEARKNMIAYLKNTEEEMAKEEEEIIKSINETPAQKAAKRKRLRKQAKEAEDLKKQLEVLVDEDDDVFVEATPIGTKVPVVNYEIVMINNKPRYKIIRADDTHQLYTSFITLLKNFDREDLEDFWKIVKARFSTSKPTNFTDDYLLVTLKNMFEKTDAQDVVWRSQQTEHGQALVKSWKLLTSYGVHIITFTTTMFVLLVEKKYPLSRFTLEQLVNVARLQVEEESEMSLELLRFTRQQLLDNQ